MASGGQGAEYAEDRALRTLSRDEALERKPSWRVWFWQQCTETGVFFASPDSGGAWQRNEDDWRDECRALFGVELAEPASEREFLTQLEREDVPMVFLSGGNDGWLPLGLLPPLENDPIDRARPLERLRNELRSCTSTSPRDSTVRTEATRNWRRRPSRHSSNWPPRSNEDNLHAATA